MRALAAAARVRDARRAALSGPTSARRRGRVAAMCRSIKRLREGAAVATDEEIREAARQYVRKVSGFGAPVRAAPGGVRRRGGGRRRASTARCSTPSPGNSPGEPGAAVSTPRPRTCGRWGRRWSTSLVALIGGLDDAPAEPPRARSRSPRRSRADPPEVGRADLRRCSPTAMAAARHTFEYSGPGYLAYIPGGGLYTAALAEFLAQGLNRYVGLWQPSPAVVQIEENVTRWLCGSVRDARGRPGGADHRRVDREPVGGRHGAPREARRGVPRRHLLRERRRRTRSVTKAATIAGFSRAPRCGSCRPTPSSGWTPTRSSR